MMTSDMIEKKTKKIKVVFDGKTIENVLSFIYTNRIKTEGQTNEEKTWLLSAADFFLLDDLKMLALWTAGVVQA